MLAEAWAENSATVGLVFWPSKKKISIVLTQYLCGNLLHSDRKWIHEYYSGLCDKVQKYLGKGKGMHLWFCSMYLYFCLCYTFIPMGLIFFFPNTVHKQNTWKMWHPSITIMPPYTYESPRVWLRLVWFVKQVVGVCFGLRSTAL